MAHPAIRVAGVLAIAACSRARPEKATARAVDAHDEQAPTTALQASPDASIDVATEDRPGALVVRAFSESGKRITQFNVRVDGIDRCIGSPCRLSDLAAGWHIVAVSAGDLASPAHGVEVRDNRTVTDAVVLEPPYGSLRVSSFVEKNPTALKRWVDVELWLDGRSIGTPPQCVTGLKVGAHSVSLYEVPLGRPPGEPDRGRLIYRRELLVPANRTLLLDPADRPGAWTTRLSGGEPWGSGRCGGPPPPSSYGGIGAVRQRCQALAHSEDMVRGVSVIVRPRGEVVVALASVEAPDDEVLVECVVEQALRWKFAQANDYSQGTFSFSLSGRFPPPLRGSLEPLRVGPSGGRDPEPAATGSVVKPL